MYINYQEKSMERGTLFLWFNIFFLSASSDLVQSVPEEDDFVQTRRHCSLSRLLSRRTFPHFCLAMPVTGPQCPDQRSSFWLCLPFLASPSFSAWAKWSCLGPLMHYLSEVWIGQPSVSFSLPILHVICFSVGGAENLGEHTHTIQTDRHTHYTQTHKHTRARKHAHTHIHTHIIKQQRERERERERR